MVVRVVARVDTVVLCVVKGFVTLVWLSFVCRVSIVDDAKGLHDVSANIDTTNRIASKVTVTEDLLVAS